VPSDDILDLLGRYATGTLSESERQRLFDAALSDQDLFEDLAREQELKMLLEEPGARDRLIRALEAPNRRTAWILSAAVAAALSVVLIAFIMRPHPSPPQVAIVTPPAPPVAMTTPEVAPPPAAAPRSVKAKTVRKSEAPANQPAIDQPAKDAVETEAKKQAVEVQAAASAIPAAQQFTPVQQGVGGPRQAVQQNRIALRDQKAAAFGFHYSVETTGHLIIVPGADGYLFVASADGTVLFNRKQIAAAITTDIVVPKDVNSILVTFSQNASPVKTAPTDRPESSGSVEGPGGLAIKIKVK
jgi:hypothetical protein